MAEEVQEKKFIELADDAPIGAARAGGEDYPEYVLVEADEALEAHLVDIKLGEKLKYQSTEMEERQFFWFEIDKGPAKGQRYRYDCKPFLTEGKGKKASNFDELMMKLVGKYPKAGEYKKSDLLGLPIRIELTEPKEYSGRKMQFISAFKKASAAQKRVEVLGGETVLTDIPSDGVNLDDLPF